MGGNGGEGFWSIYSTPPNGRAVGNIRWKVAYAGPVNTFTEAYKQMSLMFVKDGYTPVSGGNGEKLDSVWTVWGQHYPTRNWNGSTNINNYRPWVGSIGDDPSNTGGNAHAQTPYQANTKDSTAQEQWNDSHGTISSAWQRYYQCALNHWYYNKITVPTGYSRIYLHYNTWANVPGNPLDLIGLEIEAYY